MKDRVGLSFTMRSRMFGCERKALLGGLMRLSSKADKPALRMGRWFDRIATGAATVDEMEARFNKLIDDGADAEIWKEVVVIRALFKLYEDRFPDFETEDSNLVFSHPILSPTGNPHPRIEAVGEADGIEGTTLIERKTTGLTIAQRVEHIGRDNQLRGYVTGARSLGRKINSVSYRVVRKPRLRQRQKEDWVSFLTRIEDAIREDPDSHIGERKMMVGDAYTAGFQSHLWEAARRFNDMLMRGKDRCVGETGETKLTGRFLSDGYALTSLNIVQDAASSDSHAKTRAGKMYESLAEKYPQNTDRCGDYGGCDFIAICSAYGDVEPFNLFRCKSYLNPELEASSVQE